MNPDKETSSYGKELHGLRNLFGNTRNLVLTFIVLASLMISSALIELHQSKKEMMDLMTNQTHSLMESLIIASKNTLSTNAYIDNISRKRLLDNMGLVNQMLRQNEVNNILLDQICNQNSINRIVVFNKSRNEIYAGYQNRDEEIEQNERMIDALRPIFIGTQDTLILGVRRSNNEKYRLTAAIRSYSGGAIVINTDARDYLNFKKDIGFGSLLRNIVGQNSGIIYAALQDTLNILAASGNIQVLEKIGQSKFLSDALNDSLYVTRTTLFDSTEIFEAVHPFGYKGQKVGLLRIGLSLKPMQDINNRIFRRLVIISIVLMIIGSIMFIYIFTRQKFSLLQKQYTIVETYSGSIIGNVSDAIIVCDNDNGIKIFNNAAEILFKTPKENIIGTQIGDLVEIYPFLKQINSESTLQQINGLIKRQKKHLLVSRNTFLDEDQNENQIYVIRDLTEQKILEEKMERKQRLTAMGELASGVAHEIRNPLNTIGTIIQQLDKDFKPADNAEEFHELADLVHSEVKRINSTIQDFLRFARPEPIHANLFNINDFLKKIYKQFKALTTEKGIELSLINNWDGNVEWDERQMRQIFINLIQNAVEAFEGKKGSISLAIENLNDQEVEIQIRDNGPGINPKALDNIFNLYFTTKASGTGIGLSIVQRIVYEHGGVIEVDSKPGVGTSFSLKLPIRFEKNNSGGHGKG